MKHAAQLNSVRLACPEWYIRGLDDRPRNVAADKAFYPVNVVLQRVMYGPRRQVGDDWHLWQPDIVGCGFAGRQR